MQWLVRPMTAVAVVIGSIDLTWNMKTVDAPWVGDIFRGVYVGYGELLLGLVAVTALLARERNPERNRTVPQSGKTMAMIGLAFIAILCLSAIGAEAPILSLGRIAEVVGGVLLVYALSQRPDLRVWLVAGCAAVVVMQFPLVLLQEMTQSTYPLNNLFHGIQSEVVARSPGSPVLLGLDGFRWERGQGSFSHPNVLGGFAATTAILILPLCGVRSRFHHLLILAWFLAWIEIALSFSRSAALAAITGSAIWFALRRSRYDWSRSRVWIVAVVATVLCASAAVGSRELVTGLAPSTSDPAVTQRFALTQLALQLIAASPLLGVGAGNFSLAELRPPVNATYVDPVHVVPLLVAAEAGIPAGLTWLGLVLLPVFLSFRSRSAASPSFPYRLAIASVILTLGAFDHYLWSLPQGRTMFWIALGAGATE